jgi:putative ABC transport system permease protein
MIRDAREALRALGANPAFTLVVTLTLALAIGINATIFSVLYGVLLRPLDYRAPDRLVMLFERNPQLGQERSQVSTATYIDWRQRTRTFDAIGAYRYRGFTFARGGEVERVSSVLASPALFDVLGVPAEAGRAFQAADEQPGSERRALLSHGAWLRRFGGSRDVIGTTIQLDDAPYEIVGVMPAGFELPAGDASVELWTPLTIDLRTLQTRPHRMYNAIGRLKDGASIDDARADMGAVAAGIERDNPESNAGWSVSLAPLHDEVVGGVGQTLWVLFAAVGLVLLIACANVASVVLARSARTSRDFAVRAALGAGRGALLRRSLVESAVLAAAGGTVGLGLAGVGISVLGSLVPADIPRAGGIGLNVAVIGYAIAATVGAAVLFGLVPALHAMRPSVASVLQTSTRAAPMGRGGRRLSDVLVIAEVALALVLLVGAGLLLRSYARLLAVDPGFRTSHVVAAHIVLPDNRYPSAAKKRFFVDLMGQMRAQPGIAAAGAVSVLPMSPLGNDFDLGFTIDGRESAVPSERPRAAYRGVMAGYFEAMGIPLRRGRFFDSFDGREDGPRVAIVNETVAKRYFAGADPIDRMVKLPMAGDLRIVGVVGDVRSDALSAAPEASIFVPYFQLALAEMQVVVQTDLTAGEVAPRLRAALGRVDPALPIARISRIEDLLSESVARPRFNMALLVGLALCAGLLAATGVYGVVAYAVSRRTQEIGLRMALGADPGRTFAFVVYGALRVIAIGVVVGLAGAAIGGHWARTLLFGISPLDPATYVTAGVLLAALGALAASVPARRASRIDPLTALRRD